MQPLTSTQLNTLTSLLLNEKVRCYAEARTARGKGWDEQEQRFYARAHYLTETERSLRRLQEQAKGCLHLSNILTEEGYECHDCGFITRHRI